METMPTKDVLDLLVYVSAIAVAITVGRTNIKKQTILDLQNLVTAQQQRITSLERELLEKDSRICDLEETVDGYSELVREGYLARGIRQGSGNRPAHSKNPKNRNP